MIVEKWESWTRALMLFHNALINSGRTSCFEVATIQRIEKSKEIIKQDLPILDEFYPFLLAEDEHEAELLKNEIQNKFGYEPVKASPLKIARERAGLSQSELADKAGISIRTLQSYEQEQRDISKASVETLQKLTVALNCLIEDLIC